MSNMATPPGGEPAAPRERLMAFWNARYAAEGYSYGTEPNEFLVQCLPRLKSLPPGASVLCLADGEGRNGVWLARQGFAVTSVDIAEEGLRKARALAGSACVALQTQQADVTAVAPAERSWDAIVSIFLHLPARPRRELHRRCLAALRPGGLFVFEAYSREQLAFGTGGPKEIALLPTLADVEADFAGCPGAVIAHRFSGVRSVVEGPLHSGDGHVVQLVVRQDVS
ncbi:MAG: methyltransferase domain-containing protein [Ramlibacter sp.]